jgi:hypothetical protein
MKMGLIALGTVEDEFGRAKHEDKPSTLGTAQNEFESAKNENETSRP